MKKILITILLALLTVACFSSCGANNKKIIIGTMSQPGEPILEHIKDEFEKKTGYKLEIQIYNDFSAPNNALAQKEIEANLFQHQPFLDNYNASNNTNLATACIMYDCAYGGYSKKITSIENIPDGVKVTIANDASNMKRCLDLLAAEGLIVVDYGTTDVKELNPDNINDYIASNPKNLTIQPMATNLIAASLDDSDVYLGIVNATFAINAGLGTSANLVCQEQDPEHLNANIVAVNPENMDTDWCKALVEILTSAETDAFVAQTFGATVTPYHGNK